MGGAGTPQIAEPAAVSGRLVHKNSTYTYIGLPSEKYARLVSHVLRQAGVEVRDTISRNSPKEMRYTERPLGRDKRKNRSSKL